MDRKWKRSFNPMAGSYSYYSNFTLIAKRNIQAGEELFVDRTKHSTYPSSLFYDAVPSEEVYEQTDEIIKSLTTSDILMNNLNSAQWIDLLYRMKHEMLTTFSENESDKKGLLLPSSFKELMIASEIGTARLKVKTRKVEWIRKNGTYVNTTGAKHLTKKEWTNSRNRT